MKNLPFKLQIANKASAQTLKRLNL